MDMTESLVKPKGTAKNNSTPQTSEGFPDKPSNEISAKSDQTDRNSCHRVQAAGGAPPPVSFYLDTTDCGVVKINSKPLHRTHENKPNSAAPPSKRKSFRQSVTSLFSCTSAEKGSRDDNLVITPEKVPRPRPLESENTAECTSEREQPIRFDGLEDAFIHYNHDNSIPWRPLGRGLCAIFTLFTGELRGYLWDRKRAADFFHSQLGYDVYCDNKYFTDCTPKQLLDSCKWIRGVIERKAKENQGRPFYDRFVLIVLTHGLKGGLMTCADKVGVNREKVVKNGRMSNQFALIRVEEICAMFKHDQLPAMKDKPKLFLIQACRGSEVLRHAGSSQVPLKEQQYDLTNLNIRPEVPIDADQIIYYATTHDHECFVADGGSWFIDTTLRIFGRHFQNKHVEQMMTVINLNIANERGEADGQEVVQMPCKFSTLRMVFYL